MGRSSGAAGTMRKRDRARAALKGAAKGGDADGDAAASASASASAAANNTTTSTSSGDFSTLGRSRSGTFETVGNGGKKGGKGGSGGGLAGLVNSPLHADVVVAVGAVKFYAHAAVLHARVPLLLGHCVGATARALGAATAQHPAKVDAAHCVPLAPLPADAEKAKDGAAGADEDHHHGGDHDHDGEPKGRAVDGAVFFRLLHHAYADGLFAEPELTEAQLLDVAKLARHLEIPRLAWLAETAVQKRTTTKNAAAVLAHASSLGLEHAKAVAQWFVMENWKTVLADKAFSRTLGLDLYQHVVVFRASFVAGSEEEPPAQPEPGSVLRVKLQALHDATAKAAQQVVPVSSGKGTVSRRGGSSAAAAVTAAKGSSEGGPVAGAAFADASLTVRKQPFFAHRCILGVHSKRLDELLTAHVGPPKGAHPPPTELPGDKIKYLCSAPAFAALLRWAYYDDIDVPLDAAISLVPFCGLYGLDALAELCIDRLESSLTVPTALPRMALLESAGLPDYFKAFVKRHQAPACSYAIDHLTEIPHLNKTGISKNTGFLLLTELKARRGAEPKKPAAEKPAAPSKKEEEEEEEAGEEAAAAAAAKPAAEAAAEEPAAAEGEDAKPTKKGGSKKDKKKGGKSEEAGEDKAEDKPAAAAADDKEAEADDAGADAVDEGKAEEKKEPAADDDAGEKEEEAAAEEKPAAADEGGDDGEAKAGDAKAASDSGDGSDKKAKKSKKSKKA